MRRTWIARSPWATRSRRTRDKKHATSDFRLLINGKLVEGTGTLDVINPATGRVLTTAPRADRAQLDEAVAAAKAAFPTWSATPLRRRGAPAGQTGRAARSRAGRIRPPPDPGAGQAFAAGAVGDRSLDRGAPLLRHARSAARSAQRRRSSAMGWSRARRWARSRTSRTSRG